MTDPSPSPSPGSSQPLPAHLPEPCVVTRLDANALSQTIHRREVSCHAVMTAYLDRIDALNPRYNAIVNRAPRERLLVEANECDAELARGHSRGWMHGMPQAIKDTGQAVGFPTTFGSPLMAHARATQDSVHVARMKAAGAIVIGKTNMPEFGLGSNTFNKLFGTTPNAFDERVTAGGSSGGAAVALATRMLPVADGSDFMGSLRNPAAWNHVIGFRPTQGLVPAYPRPELFVSQLATDGPMGRTVQDVAKLLSIQAGMDERVPLSWRSSSTPMRPDAGVLHVKAPRLGWLGDLDGHLATEPGIVNGCRAALAGLEQRGARVERVVLDIDLNRVWRAWLVWRRALVAPIVAAALLQPGARETIKAEALWEHDEAEGLSFKDFMAASRVRGELLHAMLDALEGFDALVLPTNQCWPFALDTPWPRSISGRAMDTYHRWMEVALYATFAGLPAISLPAGFHANGRWPLGMQWIGRPMGDESLLRAAAFATAG